MKAPALTEHEFALMISVLDHHPEVTMVKLFGSRAKGTHDAASDIDLAIWGALDPLRAEAIAGELNELPLPYRFEVQAFDHIRNPTLREHIERVGFVVYPAAPIPAVDG